MGAVTNLSKEGARAFYEEIARRGIELKPWKVLGLDGVESSPISREELIDLATRGTLTTEGRIACVYNGKTYHVSDVVGLGIGDLPREEPESAEEAKRRRERMRLGSLGILLNEAVWFGIAVSQFFLGSYFIGIWNLTMVGISLYQFHRLLNFHQKAYRSFLYAGILTAILNIMISLDFGLSWVTWLILLVSAVMVVFLVPIRSYFKKKVRVEQVFI